MRKRTAPKAKPAPLPSLSYRRAAAGADARLITLRATLQGSKPKVWRDLRVPSFLSLDEIHVLLQFVFQWQNAHLHQFQTTQGTVDPPAGSGPSFAVDSMFFGGSSRGSRVTTAVTVGECLRAPGDVFSYRYDFGDNWDLELKARRIDPLEGAAADAHRPTLLGGERASPPEDCGGVWGYEDLCAIMADPKHPDHDERVEWLGYVLTPTVFDAVAMNTRMQAAVRAQRW